jgi:gamma-tubulin complex component 2
MGFEGSYIKRRAGHFTIEPHLSTPSCNIALSQLTNRILEMTSHYERLMGFIKELEFGKGVLIGALCDGLRKIVGQYYQEIIQLDEQAEKGITLQTMSVEIQDSLKIMRALTELINQARNLRSGQLISCLQRLINDTNDGFVLNVYKHIFEKLISIYVSMLSKWIYEGVIDDKYGEFMVKIEEKAALEWTNWEERFSLRTEQVPSILERDQQKILVTGKYLNILKACNREIHCPFLKDIEHNIEYHISRQNFTEPIQRAYDWANEHLLNLVFKECKLREVLTSLKGYYFLKFGDLFIYFLDVTEDELITQKKAKLDAKNRPFSV